MFARSERPSLLLEAHFSIPATAALRAAFKLNFDQSHSDLTGLIISRGETITLISTPGAAPFSVSERSESLKPAG